MQTIITAITQQAERSPESIAIESKHAIFTYAELMSEIASFAQELRQYNVHSVALLADNGPAWCIADLACLQAELTLIPIPHFFTPSQIAHLIHRAGIDAILCQQPEQLLPLLSSLHIDHASSIDLRINKLSMQLIPLHVQAVALPEACAKITFTSGSTGEPKGVCLQASVMHTVSTSLAQVTAAQADDRHLSLLPYATLLENIGGLYAPLLSGATVVSPSLADVGLSGSSGLDVQRFVNILVESKATTCIMIPQMLHALIAAIEAGAPIPHSLRFIAVGGAPVSKQLLQRAKQLALPAFEGYGLSEASSVVAVNSPSAYKAGSVGKLLPHAKVVCADDGEILVKGGLFSGYLGDAPFSASYWPTGDIGYIDDDGFLFLSGRKKHIFITAFGRNVSPEWVERELGIEPAIAQCCVFGEARPFNVAVIVAREHADAPLIQQSIDRANLQLPDYACVSAWLVADEAFTVANGLWTGTGRARRDFIFKQYQTQIEQLYDQTSTKET
ncbi:MAG: AMP-binding protein [Mariprofundus sp.]|nr:AMP-binding protein [Mariprofundus sp.]